ncbi:MAG TPA: ureidoglycolate lyase [Devosia sp.]|nr:ureidoglycolate lyase [Devosia sp.]
MTGRVLRAAPLTREAFAPFGQVIAMDGADHYPINNGNTERYHDLARIELGGVHPRPLISIFRGKPYALPFTLTKVERHPFGSQAFYPLTAAPFLVVVAPDEGGMPGAPRAFLTGPAQGINIAMNCWHGALTPLQMVSDFLVIDRGGDGKNLEEYEFDTPWTIQA